MVRQILWSAVAGVSLLVVMAADGIAAEMAMGFRVGEVTQNSAIVWTRVTRDAERNWDGYREAKKAVPKENEYTPSKVKVEDRDGATPGAVGEIRVRYSTAEDLRNAKSTEWVTVAAEHDFIQQFHIGELEPATRYYLKVEARDSGDTEVSATDIGSFGTPAMEQQWQDVSFGVVTGQSYWDLDHREGYHIYPAMQKLNLDFLVPTGDTVYLDSEAPRARTVELARFHWQRMYSLPRHVEFHRNVPGYWEVDDHDSWANDCWPTMKAKWMNPLTFEEGFKVYREQVPMGEMTYRTVRWGKGLQVWMVEGRLYRSPNTDADGPDKTIWGAEQLAWLKRTIEQSDADFRVLISPTPIVGPDRDAGKNDNHANDAFSYEGELFRSWTKSSKLTKFFTCCGDRHWQYMSVEPSSGLREFSCGPASDKHAGGNPKQPDWQPFLRVKGGFLTVSVTKANDRPTIAFRHHDVHGEVVHEFVARGTVAK
ncbi:MAG: alkaline phosphatase D family protein [Planctomycetaceae bacterium]|nr:alkaline phosphatase D family protein [Planctomycetales bacterium]MCB9926025.1 alkaline phosphatase D family protein [Planctomycetaceae bacterium]